MASVFLKNIVKTVKSVCQYALQRRLSLHTFVNRHRLFTIVQSICCIFLIQFSATSRKLLHTFGFNTLHSFDVTISGSDSKITWKLPTPLLNIHTKYKLFNPLGNRGNFSFCLKCAPLSKLLPSLFEYYRTCFNRIRCQNLWRLNDLRDLIQRPDYCSL